MGARYHDGDWSSLRTDLIKQRVTLGLQEQSEAWGNVSGGLRTGAVCTGLFTAGMKLDLETIAGWSGTTFTVSVLQIHGRGPTPNLIGSLQAVSGVEATRSTKLYNLRVEKSLLGGDLTTRVGQEGANDEFMLSKSADVFVNSSFGYPSQMALSLPSGGPNYPLAASMIRVQYLASDRYTIIGAAFDGDPAGPGTNDPQIRDRTGTAFRLRDGVLGFLELWYSAGSDAEDGRAGNLQDRCLVSRRPLQRSAARHRRAVARQPGQQRNRAAVSRRQRRLCSDGSGALANGRVRSRSGPRMSRAWP